MDSIIEGFNAIIAFLDTGMYEAADTMFERFIAWSIVSYLQMKLMSLEFAWSIASVMIEGLSISSNLQSLWSGLDSTVVNMLVFFKFPECVNIIFSAYTTRFIMGLF